MRSDTLSLFISIILAIIGIGFPYAVSNVSPLIPRVILAAAGIVLVVAILFWRSRKTDTPATGQRQTGDGNAQIGGPNTGVVHIGDVHHHAAEIPDGIPWPTAPRRSMHISRGALLQAGGSPPPQANFSMIRLTELLYGKMGPIPEGEREKVDFRRRIDLEIADQVVARNMTVWGRLADNPREEIPHHRLKRARFRHERGTLVIENASATPYTYEDVMFNASEVSEVWAQRTIFIV